MPARILIIAGSDSGGGAGIQADLKTVTMLGGYGMTAITALTAQNTQGVFGIHEVPEAFIAQQMTLALDDIGADAIKTGMLHSASVIETVAEILSTHPSALGIPFVLDPVMVAKGGAPLLAESAEVALKARLLPLASIITPNIPEAERLTGMTLRTVADMEEAGRKLLVMGAKAALIKGGHMEGDELTDLLVTPSGNERFTSRRIPTRHTHGTGCTMASAIATGLGEGLSLRKSVIRSRDYVRRAIETAPGLGKGHGPLGIPSQDPLIKEMSHSS